MHPGPTPASASDSKLPASTSEIYHNGPIRGLVEGPLSPSPIPAAQHQSEL
jgi:hypothetical protein